MLHWLLKDIFQIYLADQAMGDSKENIMESNFENPLACIEVEGNVEPNIGPSLSKRAQKKLLKRQQWLDSKQERRAKEKEKRK